MALSFYGTVAKADTFWSETEITNAWFAATIAKKTALLKKATMQIDRLAFRGEKVNVQQALQFPRIAEISPGRYTYYDVDVLTGSGSIIVPLNVEYATYIQAKGILEYEDDEVIQALLAGVTSISIGQTSMSFNANDLPVNPKTRLFREAEELLMQYFATGW